VRTEVRDEAVASTLTTSQSFHSLLNPANGQRPANAEPTEEQTMATIILMRGWDRIQAELIDDNHARDSKGQLWTRQEGHYPERWVIERADGKFDAVASRVK
jgi:hypothetical protein